VLFTALLLLDDWHRSYTRTLCWHLHAVPVAATAAAFQQIAAPSIDCCYSRCTVLVVFVASRLLALIVIAVR
jgi:hypothetical protein